MDSFSLIIVKNVRVTYLNASPWISFTEPRHKTQVKKVGSCLIGNPSAATSSPVSISSFDSGVFVPFSVKKKQ
jgi:hypothetical protein